MKKKIGIVLMGLAILLVLFASCGREESFLDMQVYDEEFREINSLLFFNEACEHSLVHTSASGLLDPAEANVYHVTKCKWGDCGYEVHYEPHRISEKLEISTQPQYKENGYFYHTVTDYCRACQERIDIYVYCLRQDADCCKNKTVLEGMDCHVNSDWREVLCDTPYVILYD